MTRIMDAPLVMPRILLDVKSSLNDNGGVRIVETGSYLRSPNVDTIIQDAIKVIRELGFQYLWIDALYIVQDDDVDKAHDIAHIYNIYRNAAFIILASRSASVAEGFLFNRKAADPGSDYPQANFLDITMPASPGQQGQKTYLKTTS
ncbi:hypothetical protein PG990_014638 [Apiospora arundinis]